MAAELVIGLVVGIVIGIFIGIFFLSQFYLEAKVESIKQEAAREHAIRMFESMKDELRKEIEAETKAKYQSELMKWKSEVEKDIRKDAIQRSAAAILGKFGEQLAPILIFLNHGINPKDMRFIGSPIDYIIFKGLSDGKPEKILFVEVKTGKSSALTPREEAIRKLVESGRVEWQTIHVPLEIEGVLGEQGIELTELISFRPQASLIEYFRDKNHTESHKESQRDN
ncbi:MAG: Holliday junction resolvase [Crenarchaeota archaeon]|nr:Holliday junction resolvase [Thermoproteota archaeon]